MLQISKNRFQRLVPKKGASVGFMMVMGEKAAYKNNKKSHHLKESKILHFNKIPPFQIECLYLHLRMVWYK
jgi:hypothetical protein